MQMPTIGVFPPVVSSAEVPGVSRKLQEPLTSIHENEKVTQHFITLGMSYLLSPSSLSCFQIM